MRLLTIDARTNQPTVLFLAGIANVTERDDGTNVLKGAGPTGYLFNKDGAFLGPITYGGGATTAATAPEPEPPTSDTAQENDFWAAQPEQGVFDTDAE